MTSMNPDIKNLLLRLGYNEASIGNIMEELEILFGDIGFDILEQKARAASDAKDATGLINTLKDMMKLMEKIRKEQEFLASCAAITQLGYILLYRATGEGKAAGSGEHVFLLVDGYTPDSMIFVDFSIDSILEINMGKYEREGNNYRLKAQVPDDETSKHIARYYSYFHVVSGIGLSHNIHNNIGIAYDKAGKHEKAFSEFTEALRLDPEQPEVFCSMGRVYYEMGSYDRSAEAWIRAVYLAPEMLEYVPEKLLLKVRRGVSRLG